MTETETTAVRAPGAESAELERALFELKRVVVGQERVLERVLVCLLARGHLLLEGVPGLAKTLTVKTLAEVFGGTFHRIQFTPDLVPSDLVGTRIYRPGDGEFATELGPVFCNFLLADEVNRAPAKVQSALLEVMQEHQVTIAGTTYPVPEPFLVLATQNPIESEGTYPAPRGAARSLHAQGARRLPGLRRRARGRAAVARRARRRSPRSSPRSASGGFRRRPPASTSTRGQRIRRAARARDAPPGRARARRARAAASPSVQAREARSASSTRRARSRCCADAATSLPQDVAELATDVLRHRIVLSYEALAEERTADEIVNAVLGAVAMPRIDLAREAA